MQVKHVDWSEAKNEILKAERGISFEEVVNALLEEGLIDTIDHPNQKLYAHQKMMIININSYAYLVPFVEDDEKIFLKTIIPSRKATKHYLIEPTKK